MIWSHQIQSSIFNFTCPLRGAWYSGPPPAYFPSPLSFVMHALWGSSLPPTPVSCVSFSPTSSQKCPTHTPLNAATLQEFHIQISYPFFISTHSSTVSWSIPFYNFTTDLHANLDLQPWALSWTPDPNASLSEYPTGTLNKYSKLNWFIFIFHFHKNLLLLTSIYGFMICQSF